MHIVCISYLLTVVKYSLVCDSDTVWNVPLYGQAELIASIVFACHSLCVWGNTALNYLCCVTCSRNNINMYISFILHFQLLVVFGTQVTLMQLGFCGQK
jgi:hypothetical protein